MNPNARAWRLILIVCAVSVAIVSTAVWYRARRISTAEILGRMPTIDSLVVYIDFEKLRQAGLVQLLDGSKAGEDPEYQAFARKTDFHWAQDLDSAALAVAPSGKYIIARGRFDWKSLRSFVASEHGECYNTLCKLGGSTPDRHISFLPLQSGVMAMAVSTDDGAAALLTGRAAASSAGVPDAPVWLSIPASVLKGDALPEGTVSFARGVSEADRVTLAFVPDGHRLAAKLTANFRNEVDASRAAQDLTQKTAILRSLIAHAHATPSPTDLAGILAAGSFQASGRRVYGYWPIDPAFVESALGARP